MVDVVDGTGQVMGPQGGAYYSCSRQHLSYFRGVGVGVG